MEDKTNREPTAEETAPSSGLLTKEQIIAGQTKLRDILTAIEEGNETPHEDIRASYNVLATDAELIRLLAEGNDKEALKRIEELTERLQLKTLFAVATLEDGTEKPLRGADLWDLMRRGLDEEEPDEDATGKLQILLGKMLDYVATRPEYRENPTADKTINAIQTIYDYLKETRSGTDPGAQEDPEAVPAGLVQHVNDYIETKDILSKVVFGELIRGGKQLSIANERKSVLKLWTTGKGKSKEDVTIYTQLVMNEQALSKAGITIGRNLSKRAREVYGAMLSYYLAGNRILTTKMIAKIIFNVSDNASLTKDQAKYIKTGAMELFLTTLFVDTTFKIDGKKTLQELCNIELVNTDQVFPGSFTEAIINGTRVKDAIVLRDLPVLYKLQSLFERGHILRVPIDYLEIPGTSSEDLVTIRGYLLQRIDTMKYNKDFSRTIIYKNILDELGIDPTDRKQRNKPKQALEKTERILNYWKEKKYIHDYRKLSVAGKVINKGAKIDKIEIIL